MLKFIENQTKNTLLYCVSVLYSGGTGRIPGIIDSALESQADWKQLSRPLASTPYFLIARVHRFAT